LAGNRTGRIASTNFSGANLLEVTKSLQLYNRPEDFVFPWERLKGDKPLDLASALKRKIQPAFKSASVPFKPGWLGRCLLSVSFPAGFVHVRRLVGLNLERIDDCDA
jgi:hypothetical protein